MCSKVISNIKHSLSYFSLSLLEEEEDEENTSGVGLVHQAILDNNTEKLEKLIEVS